MKDPVTHYAINDHPDADICMKDSQPWPCNTWRKWLKSPEYRIAQLEKIVEELQARDAATSKRIADLEKLAYRAKLIQDAQTEWLGSLNRHTGQCQKIQIIWSRQIIDTTSATSKWATYAPGRETFKVRFGDGDWKY